ncbi:MAG: hypothetical protein IPO44_03775 [Candidatus Microthrix sp.]|nr:hypothetical protein [Candidatus Microthrix sp.]MBK9558709.1 hypothetical protein [Candidatus Microthrix sp.]
MGEHEVVVTQDLFRGRGLRVGAGADDIEFNAQLLSCLMGGEEVRRPLQHVVGEQQHPAQ